MSLVAGLGAGEVVGTFMEYLEIWQWRLLYEMRELRKAGRSVENVEVLDGRV